MNFFFSDWFHKNLNSVDNLINGNHKTNTKKKKKNQKENQQQNPKTQNEHTKLQYIKTTV